MTTTIKSSADGLTATLQVNGVDKLNVGADMSGHLAGFRNILINGDMRINQRGVTIAAAANGAYGPDRWKKVDAGNMTQIVEAGNFKPNTVYALSGVGITTQQITSPASGNWTMPNIPIAATNIQCEEGSIATPFEHRPYGLELSLCQRYYLKVTASVSAPYCNAFADTTVVGRGIVSFPEEMRIPPTAVETSGVAGDYRIRYQGGNAAACSVIPVHMVSSKTCCSLAFTIGSGVLTVGNGLMLESASSGSYLAWSAEL